MQDTTSVKYYFGTRYVVPSTILKHTERIRTALPVVELNHRGYLPHRPDANVLQYGTRYGNRTRLSGVKGQRPNR